MKYRRRAVTFDVEAAQFREDRSAATVIQMGGDLNNCIFHDDVGYYVITIHGHRTPIVDGEWIIRERSTAYRAYPCKPDIFAATYEPVEEEQ